jgi:hypothetical protein
MARGTAVAAAAFQQTLERFGLTPGEEGLGDPVDLGRRAGLLAIADRIWRRQIGPLLDGRDVQRLLRVRTRQAVSDLVKRRRLLAMPIAEGSLAYPAFQFTHGGRPDAALPRILELFAKAAVDAHTIASWFTTPQALLRRKTPAQWLKERGDPSAVIEAARRTASRLGR